MSRWTEQLKQGAGQAWQSLAEGWHELGERAGNALTRFRPGARAQDDEATRAAWLQAGRWGFMAADVFDDGERLVVRLEAPGLKREDFHVELGDGMLSVWGEKRFDEVEQSGRYRVVQCAYGSFRRDVPLPAAVDTGRARASYRDGVLRIELPRFEPARAHRIAVRGA